MIKEFLVDSRFVAREHGQDTYGTTNEFVDYALLDRLGRPLAIVEAKHSSRAALEGERQAADYADAVRAKHGIDPFIFLANGDEIWFWHRKLYPPRKVSGFFSEEDLSRLAHLDKYGKPLSGTMPLEKIIDRAYQIEAVKTIIERIEAAKRRFLMVLATGTGKTRVAVALTELLQRHERIQRVLFLLLPSYRRFPGNEEFERQIQMRNLYAFNRRSYWLRRFENHGRKERVQIQDYTIEHIMPQNESLGEAWKADLGENWEHIHSQYLHTLGNLTLTGYNSEYSDRPFKEKRDREGGFRHSPLKLNQGLAECEVWNEASIQARAQRLAREAAVIWSAPQLTEDILAAYRSQEKAALTSDYTIADHPNLHTGKIRELFDAFRAEVLVLDECVHEEILKLYIAYKAETNFVDVVPQAKRLRLSLNLAFSEIDDPRGLCKDVTKMGRWGNGDVEVGLDKLEDLPYVIGLVRQSLEKQLGDEG